MEKKNLNRHVATSLDGFVQYLVTSLICRGYRWYVTGHIPKGKSAERIDEKLIAKYGSDRAKSTRWRRKKNGLANARYMRIEEFFIIMVTDGIHEFFHEEKDVKDIRIHPVRVGPYSISFRPDSKPAKGDGGGRRVHVQIDSPKYQELEARFLHFSTRMKADALAGMLYELPYRGYAPVRSQLCQLLRKVNKKRKRSGLSQLPKECLFFHRRSVKVFE